MGNTVCGEYNALSYTIFHNGKDVYQAGNSPLDSQVYLSAKKGVGLAKMKEFCISTAKETAEELGAEYTGVSFDGNE